MSEMSTMLACAHAFSIAATAEDARIHSLAPAKLLATRMRTLPARAAACGTRAYSSTSAPFTSW